jgi:hypothetical protein
MSGPTRKAVAAALLAQLAPPGSPFTGSVGRRLRDPEGSAQPGQPGLFLIKPHERFDRSKSMLPPKRDLHFLAVIYTDVSNDQTLIPADIIDDLIDYVEGQLAPDTATGRQTLAGLVQSVMIDGDINFAPGDDIGKGETVIPIRVTLP